MTTAPREDVPTRKSDAAYETLKGLVLNGRIRPGRHLVLYDLAEHLKIGETPLRDAMLRLATEGLLARDNSSGFSTKEFRVDEQRQILELCDLMLTHAVLNAGDRVSGQLLTDLAELENAPAATIEEAAQLAGRIRDMYLEIARAAGNDVLRDQCRVMVDRSHMVRMLDLQIGESGRHTIDDLREFGVAMAAREVEQAVASVKAILGRRIDRLPLLVKEANFLASDASFP
ncbi:GntR family transcriptional regulator [Sphingobium sp. LB126]|uniref:GntR family transcriptional regulator n=1 Tax=Sphingobium sp. LB126 TaxID=1983755 RepID=UPI0018D55543|nr:GntR family transcriptional regulator [Sphingobium sp. LB126]